LSPSGISVLLGRPARVRDVIVVRVPCPSATLPLLTRAPSRMSLIIAGPASGENVTSLRILAELPHSMVRAASRSNARFVLALVGSVTIRAKFFAISGLAAINRATGSLGSAGRHR
jgi:purine nucleoside permease